MATTADITAAEKAAERAQKAQNAARDACIDAFCHAVAQCAPAMQRKVSSVDRLMESNVEVRVLQATLVAENEEIDKLPKPASRDSFVQSVPSDAAPGACSIYA